MNRRQALGLLGFGGIDVLVNSHPAVQTLYAVGQNNPAAPQSPNAKNDDESKLLARRIAGYILEHRELFPKVGTGYVHCDCGTYFDKTNGQNVNAYVDQRMKELYAIDPEKVKNHDPEDFIPNIVLWQGHEHKIEIDRENIQASAEVTVFFKDNNPDAGLNWDDTKNYLKINWFDESTSRWIRLTDNGIDGIVDEILNPFLVDKQAAYLAYLRMLDQMYPKP